MYILLHTYMYIHVDACRHVCTCVCVDTYIYIHSRGVEGRKEDLEIFGIKNSGGERGRVRGEEERGEKEGEK